MIEFILFFLLGFLAAGFLALMVAPAIWRRAVALTRKRIEATVPLSMDEIQADKDRLRAEFAMSTRRLEMSVESLREKAAAQLVEISRNREELKHLADQHDDRDRIISELEAKASELRNDIQRREEELSVYARRVADAERLLEERASEVEKLGRMYDEASFSASERQIELAARDSEVERLSTDMGAARTQRKDAESRLRLTAADALSAQEALKAERKRSADLEQRVERILATVADREEKLDRREKELARLRQETHGGSRELADVEAKLTEAQADRVKLEAEVAELTLAMSKLVPGGGAEARKAVERLEAEKAQLEQRLTLLVRENRKLKSKDGKPEADGAGAGDALLRDQINELAAEVVALTAKLEGPDSPICKVLADNDSSVARTDGGEKILSLADRVRALQKATSPS